MVRVSKHTISVSAACKWSRGFHGTCDQLSEARGVLNAPPPPPSRSSFSTSSPPLATILHFFSAIVACRFPYTPNNVQITDFRSPFVSNWHLSQNGAASLQNSGSGTGKLQVSTSKMGFRCSEGPAAALVWAAGRGGFACSIKSEKKCVKIGTLRTKPG